MDDVEIGNLIHDIHYESETDVLLYILLSRYSCMGKFHLK